MHFLTILRAAPVIQLINKGKMKERIIKGVILEERLLIQEEPIQAGILILMVMARTIFVWMIDERHLMLLSMLK